MLDWDDLKTFLAISRHGSLSAAARAFKVSQTTMGRRLEHLHQQAGARLLEKSPSGFHLTPTGSRVLEHAIRMETEALAIERSIAGEDRRLGGVVRLTTVEAFSAHILVPGLQTLAARHPGIAVEVITDTRTLSLARREADIAVRIGKFESHDTIVRRIGAIAFGLYASEYYLNRYGMPSWQDGAAEQRVIRLQDDLLLTPEARWLSSIAAAADGGVLANSRELQLRAVLAGIGFACLPRYLADGHGLRLLAPPSPPPVREIWMGVHRDARQMPRIRAVQDAMIACVDEAKARLLPDGA